MMNPDEFVLFGRSGRFPVRAVLGIVGVFVVIFGLPLGCYFHARHGLGEPMIAGLQNASPEAVIRITIRPARGQGRQSGDELDSQTLTKTAVEITDREDIRVLMEAIRNARPSPSPNRRDDIRWTCSLLIATTDRAWQCKATATGRGVVLDFWSHGLSGWSLGAVSSEALTEILPQTAKLTPPR